NDRPEGVAAMAASDILLVDDAQDSFISLSDVIWDLNYQGIEAYDGPAARELSQSYTSNLALLDYKLPGADGVELDGRLKQVQPGAGHQRRHGPGLALGGGHVQPARLRDVQLQRVRPVRRRLHHGGYLHRGRLPRRPLEAVQPVLDLRQQQ